MAVATKPLSDDLKLALEGAKGAAEIAMKYYELDRQSLEV